MQALGLVVFAVLLLSGCAAPTAVPTESGPPPLQPPLILRIPLDQEDGVWISWANVTGMSTTGPGVAFGWAVDNPSVPTQSATYGIIMASGFLENATGNPGSGGPRHYLLHAFSGSQNSASGIIIRKDGGFLLGQESGTGPKTQSGNIKTIPGGQLGPAVRFVFAVVFSVPPGSVPPGATLDVSVQALDPKVGFDTPTNETHVRMGWLHSGNPSPAARTLGVQSTFGRGLRLDTISVDYSFQTPGPSVVFWSAIAPAHQHVRVRFWVDGQLKVEDESTLQSPSYGKWHFYVTAQSSEYRFQAEATGLSEFGGSTLAMLLWANMPFSAPGIEPAS
jgi:hypothetical protein